MGYRRASTIVGPPVNALVDALGPIGGGDLRLVAEFDATSRRLLYVSDRVADRRGGPDGLEPAADALLEYYRVDSLERDRSGDLLRLGDAETFVTYFDRGVAVRTHVDDAALLVALEDAAHVDDVRSAVRDVLGPA